MRKALSLEEQKVILEKIKYDKKVFGEIYDVYFDTIFGYIVCRIGDEDISYDIAAKTFFNALKTIDNFHFKGVSISSRLYTIAGNEMKKYYNKSSLYQKTSITPIEETIASEIGADSDAKEKDFLEEQKRQKSILQTALKKLNHSQQQAIILRYWENKNIKEIAEILGKSESNTKVILHRATKNLEKILPNNLLNND